MYLSRAVRTTNFKYVDAIRTIKYDDSRIDQSVCNYISLEDKTLKDILNEHFYNIFHMKYPDYSSVLFWMFGEYGWLCVVGASGIHSCVVVYYHMVNSSASRGLKAITRNINRTRL